MNNSTDCCDILRRPADAIAFVKGKERFSSVDGTVRFYQLRSSVVVRAEIQGLPKGCCCNSPIFAFHIHDGEECSGNILDAFADADGFATIDLCDAERARRAGWHKRVLLLEGFFDETDIEPLQDLDVETVVHSFWQIDILKRLPLREVKVHIKVN